MSILSAKSGTAAKHALAGQDGQPLPALVLWSVFFVYATSLALLMQLVLLPYVLPTFHGGDGLLANGDWVMFHRIAVDLAQRIHEEGWSVWVLRPQVSAPAGIAAAIYVLTVPAPWTMIPINAALFATAGLALFQVLRLFVPDPWVALCCSLPFLLYPTAMIMYTQLHKEGFFVAGCMLALWGWLGLSRVETWRRGCWPPSRALLSIIVGALLVWVMRPYGVQMLQAVGMVLAVLLTAAYLARGASAGLPWTRVILAVAAAWLVVVALRPLLPSGLTDFAVEAGDAPALEAGDAPADPWQPSPWLPASVDNQLHALASIHAHQLASRQGRDVRSDFDRDVALDSALDMAGYLPRLLQIALLAPFPGQWLEPGSSELTSMARRVAGLEMAGVYLSLTLLPYAIWRWRRRVELWIVLIFCGAMMLTYAIAVPNVGSLYRVRYGFLMTLVALALAGGVSARRSRGQ